MNSKCRQCLFQSIFILLLHIQWYIRDQKYHIGMISTGTKGCEYIQESSSGVLICVQNTDGDTSVKGCSFGGDIMTYYAEQKRRYGNVVLVTS